MKIGNLKRLFAAGRRTNDGRPVPAIWIADRGQAALINPESGRVFAYVWHDGCGKYYPTVIVSPWRAIRLMRTEPCFLVSLLSFPRMTVEMLRLKVDSLRTAQQFVEAVLGTPIAR